MNKNRTRIVRANHKAMKQSGFPKPIFKAKKKLFPVPNKDESVSLANQRAVFYGK